MILAYSIIMGCIFVRKNTASGRFEPPTLLCMRSL